MCFQKVIYTDESVFKYSRLFLPSQCKEICYKCLPYSTIQCQTFCFNTSLANHRCTHAFTQRRVKHVTPKIKHYIQVQSNFQDREEKRTHMQLSQNMKNRARMAIKKHSNSSHWPTLAHVNSLRGEQKA